MSIFTANLKHFYQRRGLWLVYAWIGSMLSFNIMIWRNDPKNSIYMSMFMLIFLLYFLGYIAVTMQIEILNKPFTYCLSGHRKIARKFLLLAGLSVSLLFSLPFLLYPGLDLGRLLIVVLSAFSVFLSGYWISVGVNLLIYNRVKWAGFLYFILFGGMFLGFIYCKVLGDMILRFPALFIAIGMFCSIFAWLQLGDDSLARRYCAKPILGLAGAWDRDRMQRLSRARIAEKGDKIFRDAPWVEQFFLGRMMQSKVLSTGRSIWGSLYTTFGPNLSMGRAILYQTMIFVLLLCFLGYIDGYMKRSSSASFMLFIMPCMITIFIQLPFYSSLLIAGGRRERFFSTMTVIAATVLIVTVAILMLTALAQPLEKVMPEIILRGQKFTFQAPDIRLSFVPLLIMPIFFILNILIRQKFILFMLTIMIFSMSFPILMLVGHRTMQAPPPHPVEAWLAAAMNPVTIAALIVLSWLILTAVLHYVCTKRPLTGQGRV